MATEIADGVWWFDLRGVNAYLLAGRGDGATGDESATGVTLIDTGGPWTRRALRDGLDAAGFAPRDVDRVALTHYDIDHVGGCSGLDLDVPIYAGLPDAAVLQGDRSPGWRNRKAAFQSATQLLAPSVDSVESVTDGDVVGGLTVYETPGHTSGHVAYVSESRSVAFVGDLVREADGRLEPSPWALSEDTDAVRASIRRLASLSLDVDVVAMGHGTPFVERGGEHLADLAGRL